MIDGALSLGCGLVTGFAYLVSHATEADTSVPKLGGSVLCGALAVSFVNHVILVLLARRSVGKALVGTRVVRTADGGRPRLHQALGRWLGGFFFGIVVLPLAFAAGGSEAEPQDFAGLRIVRPRKGSQTDGFPQNRPAQDWDETPDRSGR
ncbi:RDD family protein [Streptomyces sp. YC537]|uniref:RDD family protein n=1 Tax=Streptomyces boluensis TaxID=1775135 RepID=A0A964XNB6_9ACTN|nr:RDD family protein [Streptomyces boluensis]